MKRISTTILFILESECVHSKYVYHQIDGMSASRILD